MRVIKLSIDWDSATGVLVESIAHLPKVCVKGHLIEKIEDPIPLLQPENLGYKTRVITGDLPLWVNGILYRSNSLAHIYKASGGVGFSEPDYRAYRLTRSHRAPEIWACLNRWRVWIVEDASGELEQELVEEVAKEFDIIIEQHSSRRMLLIAGDSMELESTGEECDVCLVEKAIEMDKKEVERQGNLYIYKVEIDQVDIWDKLERDTVSLFNHKGSLASTSRIVYRNGMVYRLFSIEDGLAVEIKSPDHPDEEVEISDSGVYLMAHPIPGSSGD